MCEKCAVLERENDDLRFRIEQMLRPLAWEPPVEWRLSKAEADTLGYLVASAGSVTKEGLLAATSPDIGFDERDMKIVDVFVCKLRAKIAPFGWTIATLWGRGYDLPPEQRAALRAGAVRWCPTDAPSFQSSRSITRPLESGT